MTINLDYAEGYDYIKRKGVLEEIFMNKEEEKKKNIYDETSLDREIVFHYSRERRLAKAPARVREMYSPNRPRGFLRSLAGTRSNGALLLVIVVMCAFIPILARFTRETNLPNIGGNFIHTSAIRSGDGMSFTLKKSFRNPNADVYTGAVDIAIMPSQSMYGSDVFTQRIFFSLNQEEEYRFNIPFQAPSLLVGMQAEDLHIRFKVNPK